MTININDPDFPPLHMHLSEQTLARIKHAQSPVKQTFLLSPTPSEETLRTDSPVLPYFPAQDTLTNFSTPSNPVSPLSASSNRDKVNKSTLLPSAVRTTDILPDNTDLYMESRPPTRRGKNTPVSYTQHHSIVEQDVILGPEVKEQLPIIRDHDFPYYPLPPYFLPPRNLVQSEPRLEWGDERVWVQRKGTRGLGLKKFLRSAFRKYGVRRV